MISEREPYAAGRVIVGGFCKQCYRVGNFGFSPPKTESNKFGILIFWCPGEFEENGYILNHIFASVY